MKRGAQRRIFAGLVVAAAGVTCVSYDPTGPHAPAMNGTFAARIITTLHNDLQSRQDTSVLTLTLRDSLYRGRFYGYYRFVDGDSGLVAGTVYTPERVEINQFGDWPPLTHVGYLERLYASCGFSALGPIYILGGGVGGDTVAVNAQGTLPCSESTSSGIVELITQFTISLVGVRQ